MPKKCLTASRRRKRSMLACAGKAACLLIAGWAAGELGFVSTAHAGQLGNFVEGFRHAAAEGRTTHTLSVDNDTFVLGGEDGFYSSGLFYTRQHQVREDNQVSVYGWRIGQELYTASNTQLTPEQISPNDRPYAAWLYAGAFKQTIRADGSAGKWGVDLGCLGYCAGGEWAQKTIHRILNQSLPKGWDKQVNNEVGIVLHAEQAFAPWQLGSRAVLTPIVRGRFGNIYTDASAAMLLKIGEEEKARGESDVHGFFRLEGRAVAYNATLQGGYFSKGDPHTVDPRRLVAEAEIGIVWRLDRFALLFSITRRSNEIRDLPNAFGRQDFGTLQISYSPLKH